jgi:RNA polymerase sigma factor (TIGR02999 family)
VASAELMVLESTSVTHLLKAWSGGYQGALEELTPKVYLELRRMAAKYMRNEKAGNTRQATALVHEVFLRLVEVDSVSWQDRAHFFAVSANMMRRILVDRARAKGMAKRGGAALRPNLDDVPDSPRAPVVRLSPSMKRCVRWLRSTRARRRSSNCDFSEGSPWRRRQKC